MLNDIVLKYEKYLKGHLFTIVLVDDTIINFQIAKKRLKHLLGFQHTSYRRFPAELIYSKIKNGSLTLKKLEKDKNYKIVKSRILNFTKIIDLLKLTPDDFIIEFNCLLLENCKLKSKYIIYQDNGNNILHLGLADNNNFYPETWFVRDKRLKNIDIYIRGQKQVKIKTFEVKIIN